MKEGKHSIEATSLSEPEVDKCVALERIARELDQTRSLLLSLQEALAANSLRIDFDKGAMVQLQNLDLATQRIENLARASLLISQTPGASIATEDLKAVITLRDVYDGMVGFNLHPVIEKSINPAINSNKSAEDEDVTWL